MKTLEIKAMTFNIHHGRGSDKKADLGRIADVIAFCKPDIIGLNEVDSHFSKRSLYEDQADWLAKQCGMDYAFCPSIWKKTKYLAKERQFGNALLSRFSIVDNATHSFTMPGLSEGRSLLEAKVQIETLSLQIIVTHLSLNPLLHKKQTDYIMKLQQNKAKPVVIMGDWNMKPRSKRWQNVAKEFQDAWEAVGKGTGFTYPAHRPRMRLDYIFASHHFHILDAGVVNITPEASDHLPVVATLFYGG